ncbi:hypothetical protein JCM10212_001752 [Sporobolomyces blumeae]
MLPDGILSRFVVRAGVLAFDSILPLAVVHTIAAYWTYPAPPAVAWTLSLAPDAAADFLFDHRLAFRALTIWLALEVAWWPVAKATAFAIDHRWWDAQQDEKISPEERWRLFANMLESAEDPQDWLKAFFLMPGKKSAPRGADDPAVRGVDLEKVGRTNVEEVLAFVMFNALLKELKPKSTERAELSLMIKLLETTLTLSRTRADPASTPFRFLRGKSPHKALLLSQERLRFGHMPVLFYAITWVASQLGCLALYLAGFRYFGQPTTWPLPLFFMRSSTASLEGLLDPSEHAKMGPSTLTRRTGYWFKPARGKAQELDQRPLVFCHGISGIYGPACFLALMSWLSERAIFIPVLPYLSMRLSPPSAIITRHEYVASVRRMLWRHGFGLTCLDPDEDDPEDWTEAEEEEERTREEVDAHARIAGRNGLKEEKEGEEEWRRGKAIVVAHSAGAGAAGWLMRDAPDIVSGLVLIDPMSFLLFCPDSVRNFYRTKCRAAGEHFFRYFAYERGINHYLSRHTLWSTTTLFTPHTTPVAPLPSDLKRRVVPACARWTQEGPYDVPRYAAEVDPADGDRFGPFPTVVFLSSEDCILPIPKLVAYFSRSKFGSIWEGSTPTKLEPRPDGRASGDSKRDEDVTRDSNGLANGAVVRTNGTEVEFKGRGRPSRTERGSVRVMSGLEHAAILLRPDWCREVVRAVDQVGDRADEWERRERIDLLQG